ncbi:MAG: hypothetical protein A2Z99_20105 [Treponema sp. GWB1_62_6]|nr:MAG: hypothetical protein A2Z99_20105 [Treponema sp. GWB1_62_6]
MHDLLSDLRVDAPVNDAEDEKTRQRRKRRNQAAELDDELSPQFHFICSDPKRMIFLPGAPAYGK